MSADHAFADESARGQTYFVVAVLVPSDDLKDLRRVARSYCRPGQRRWHVSKERDSRRATIIDALVATDRVRAWISRGKGEQARVRALCMSRLGQNLAETGVRRLVIESRGGLRRAGPAGPFPSLERP